MIPMEELLIVILKEASDNDARALLLESYIQDYGPLSEKAGEIVRQILEEGEQ